MDLMLKLTQRNLIAQNSNVLKACLIRLREQTFIPARTLTNYVVCHPSLQLKRHQHVIKDRNQVHVQRCLQKTVHCRTYSTVFDGSNADLDCDVDELNELIKSDSVNLIDIRNPHELDQDGRIHGAVNIPLDYLSDALQLTNEEFDKLYKISKPSEDGSNVVFHCLGGIRSLKALQIAHEHGMTKSRHLPGGLCAWQERFGRQN